MTLLAFITAHRMQTLALIDVRDLERSNEAITITIPEKIKTSRVHKTQPTLHIPYYRDNLIICAASTLDLYVEKTRELRGSEN